MQEKNVYSLNWYTMWCNRTPILLVNYYKLWRLEFDTPLSSTAAVPQSLLPSHPHSWLPSTNPLTVAPYTSFNPSCRFHFPPSLSPLPLALTLHLLPFLPPLSLFFLENVDDDAFLDCLHEYRGLQSDVAYFLSAIFCDTLLPPHGAVNWSECSCSTLVWSEMRILLCLLNNAGYVI